MKHTKTKIPKPFMSFSTPQFENYEWGKSIEEVKRLVEKKSILEDANNKNENVISYKDTILKGEVRVLLFFTPETKKLYSVLLRLYNYVYTFDLLLEVLTGKYGDPSKTESIFKRKDLFRWESDKYLLEVRDYSDSIWILYRCNYSWSLYEIESIRKEHGEEVDRF